MHHVNLDEFIPGSQLGARFYAQ